MKISRGVSYQRVGDKIFVHNVNTAQSYLFDGSVEKIFDYVAANPTHSVPKLLKFFVAGHLGRDSDKIQRDIGNFVDEMLGEQILTEVDELYDLPTVTCSTLRLRKKFPSSANSFPPQSL